VLLNLLRSLVRAALPRTERLEIDAAKAAGFSNSEMRRIDAALLDGQFDLVVDLVQEYLASGTATAPLLSNLGVAYWKTGKLLSAISTLERSIELDRENPHAWQNLGLVYLHLADHPNALRSYREAIRLDPVSGSTYSSYLSMLNYIEGWSQARVVEEHRRWGDALMRRVGQRRHVAREQLGRICIGFISADFYAHSTYYFLSPLLKQFDRNKFRLVCYDNRGKPDWATTALASAVDAWNVIVALDDGVVADMVEKDGIDILIDLSGHTLGNRLETFARKPAPIQVTWVGYPQTTGLAAIDYRITDRILDPPGREVSGAERCWYLPDCTACFEPPTSLAARATVPANENQAVLFGCINHYFKVSDSAVAAWSSLLQKVEHSVLRLYVADVEEEEVRLSVLGRFSAAGIGPERLDLRGRCEAEVFFDELKEIDIVLDPFPYNGGTTTNLALWAGVPVVTLAGDRPTSRCGMMILSALGLDELVATTTEQYIGIAEQLSKDRRHLVEISLSLRERYLRSPLIDSKSFADNFQQALLSIWALHLAGGNNDSATISE